MNTYDVAYLILALIMFFGVGAAVGGACGYIRKARELRALTDTGEPSLTDFGYVYVLSAGRYCELIAAENYIRSQRRMKKS